MKMGGHQLDFQPAFHDRLTSKGVAFFTMRTFEFSVAMAMPGWNPAIPTTTAESAHLRMTALFRRPESEIIRSFGSDLFTCRLLLVVEYDVAPQRLFT